MDWLLTWEGLALWSPWMEVLVIVSLGALGTYAIIAISDRRKRQHHRAQRFVDRLNERSERSRDRSGRDDA